MNSINTPVRLFRASGDKKYLVSFEAIDKELMGEQVEVIYKRQKIAEGYLHEVKVSSLTDITDLDLAPLHKAFRTKPLFWRQMERAYGGGLPGEFKVTLFTVSDEPAQLPPKNRKKPSLPFKVKAYEDTPIYEAGLKDLLSE